MAASAKKQTTKKTDGIHDAKQCGHMDKLVPGNNCTWCGSCVVQCACMGALGVSTREPPGLCCTLALLQLGGSGSGPCRASCQEQQEQQQQQRFRCLHACHAAPGRFTVGCRLQERSGASAGRQRRRWRWAAAAPAARQERRGPRSQLYHAQGPPTRSVGEGLERKARGRRGEARDCEARKRGDRAGAAGQVLLEQKSTSDNDCR